MTRCAVTTRLLRAEAKFVQTARRGALPPQAHWITDSRLVFLRKVGSETPRPIRVGEMLRRVVAKRIAFDTRSANLKHLASVRQCGVGLPGGAEALIHLRRCMEEALAGDECPVVAILDLDLRNAFPSLEWPAIRAAVASQAGDISPWTEWCHQKAARINLPAGVWTTCDRGAEQGDPLGSLYCALVLVDCAAAAAAAVRAAGYWVADFWFADDGQVILPPDAVDLYLRAFDASLSAVGGTRVGTDGKVKSTVKLLGPPGAMAATPGEWCTEYVSTSCKVVRNGPGGLVLGVGITATDGRELWAAAATEAERVRAALPLVDDPAAELSLLRMCMGGCRLTRRLRGLGPDLQEQDIADADHAIESPCPRC